MSASVLLVAAVFLAGVACVLSLLSLGVACINTNQMNELGKRLDEHDEKLKALASLAHYHIETRTPLADQALQVLKAWSPSGPPS